MVAEGAGARRMKVGDDPEFVSILTEHRCDSLPPAPSSALSVERCLVALGALCISQHIADISLSA